MEGRTLTVGCWAGLSNRLRVLVSGMALAEATGRRFTMLWPRAPCCGACFAELFSNRWPVETATMDEVTAMPQFGGYNYLPLPDLMTAEEAQVTLATFDWLVPAVSPLTGGWRRRIEPWLRRTGLTGRRSAPIRLEHQSAMGRAAELFGELRPVPAIRERIERFRNEQFGGRPMIGVHLRRGDFHRVRPDVTGNVQAVERRVARWHARAPEAGIFLCTDDGAIDPKTRQTPAAAGIRERFRSRFGAPVVWTEPRTLDRQDPKAIEDAVVDLWLLRDTAWFVGSLASSFSELAVFGRAMEPGRAAWIGGFAGRLPAKLPGY